MKRRAFLRGMLAASAAPYVLTADGAFIPLSKLATNAPFVPDIVQLGELAGDGPNWQLASRGLSYAWVRPGGDYRDASGVQNGSNHYASTTEGATATWSIPAALILALQKENTGFYLSTTGTIPSKFAGRQSATPPTLEVVTTTDTFNLVCSANCWITPASVNTWPAANPNDPRMSFPAMVKFDLSGLTGTVLRATLTITYTNIYIQSGHTISRIYADYLDMPALVHDPARQLGGVVQGIAAGVENDLALASHPSVIFYPSFDSNAAVRASGWTNLPSHNGEDVCLNPVYVEWPEYGLTALRITTPSPGVQAPNGGGSSILSWRRELGAGNHTELYARWLMKIDEDAFLALNEQGVKLSGFSDTDAFSTVEEFSYRMWCGDHLQPADRASGRVANPNVYRLFLHAYDSTHAPGTVAAAENRATSVCLAAGRIYSIEQRVKLNTFTGGVPNADGIMQVWVDGVLAYNDTTRVINNDQVPFVIERFLAQFFHGGSNTPLAPYHYELGAVAVATEYIGPPKVVSTVPAWVPPAGQIGVVPMASTFASVDPCPARNCNYSFVQGQTGIFTESGSEYASEWGTLGGIFKAGGGHNNYGGNESYIFDLDTLGWKRLDNPSTTPDVSANGVAAKQAEQELWPWGEYEDGQPCSLHSYGRHVYLPPSMGGAAPKGSIVRVAGGIYVANNKGSHVLDLNKVNTVDPSLSTRWTRWAANLPAGLSHGPVVSACIDASRNRLWVYSYTFQIWYADLATRTFIDEINLQSAGRPGSNTHLGNLLYVAALDKITYWSTSGAPPGSGMVQVSGWYLTDMDNPGLGFTRINLTGDPLPITPTPSSTERRTQCDINMAGNGKLYLVTPADAAIYQITPAATPEGTWKVARLPYTGTREAIDAWNVARDVMAGGGHGKQFRNFSWCSKVGCFVWPYAGGTRAPLCFTPPND